MFAFRHSFRKSKHFGIIFTWIYFIFTFLLIKFEQLCVFRNVEWLPYKIKKKLYRESLRVSSLKDYETFDYTKYFKCFYRYTLECYFVSNRLNSEYSQFIERNSWSKYWIVIYFFFWFYLFIYFFLCVLRNGRRPLICLPNVHRRRLHKNKCQK